MCGFQFNLKKNTMTKNTFKIMFATRLPETTLFKGNSLV